MTPCPPFAVGEALSQHLHRHNVLVADGDMEHTERPMHAVHAVARCCLNSTTPTLVPAVHACLCMRRHARHSESCVGWCGHWRRHHPWTKPIGDAGVLRRRFDVRVPSRPASHSMQCCHSCNAAYDAGSSAILSAAPDEALRAWRIVQGRSMRSVLPKPPAASLVTSVSC